MRQFLTAAVVMNLGRPGDFAPARVSTAATLQNGRAPEYLTALANELHAAAWLNMPHLAEDDYVRHFARLEHDRPEPARTIPVGRTDAVWIYVGNPAAT